MSAQERKKLKVKLELGWHSRGSGVITRIFHSSLKGETDPLPACPVFECHLQPSEHLQGTDKTLNTTPNITAQFSSQKPADCAHKAFSFTKRHYYSTHTQLWLTSYPFTRNEKTVAIDSYRTRSFTRPYSQPCPYIDYLPYLPYIPTETHQGLANHQPDC